ncbi:hypothetical protein [Bradyrhizobium centrosematis]|uniref:hypothetical protein n=1 Tax=Bradyrhizobium centrosematis TaxID=1300039 RepID=UPI00388D5EFC
MRGIVAILLLASAIHAFAWGLFRSSGSETHKLAATALLMGIFLSLPILKVHRPYFSVLFLAVLANAVAGAAVGLAAYLSQFGFPTGTMAAAMTAGVSMLVLLGGILLSRIDTRGAARSLEERSRTLATRWITLRIKKPPPSDSVSENYFSKVWTQSIAATCGLFVLSLVAVFLQEFSAAILSASMAAIIIAHLALTKIRVRGGLFPSNSEEVQEVISFILARYHQDGRPPGGRLYEAHAGGEGFSEEPVGSAIPGDA